MVLWNKWDLSLPNLWWYFGPNGTYPYIICDGTLGKMGPISTSLVMALWAKWALSHLTCDGTLEQKSPNLPNLWRYFGTNEPYLYLTGDGNLNQMTSVSPWLFGLSDLTISNYSSLEDETPLLLSRQNIQHKITDKIGLFNVIWKLFTKVKANFEN